MVEIRGAGQEAGNKQAPGTRLARILVATDGSSHAMAAVARAATLSAPDRTEIHVVTVVSSQFPESVSASVRSAATDIAEAAAAQLRPHAARVSIEVVDGEPYEKIVQRARVHAAELVVLGAHSKHPGTWVLGTTADRVVRRGSAPVLVVRRPGQNRYERPVLATDLSDVSRATVDLASSVLESGIGVRVVHAYRVPFQGFLESAVPSDQMQEHRAELRAHARERVRELTSWFEHEGHPVVTVLREGDARRVVVSDLLLTNADIVVVGTHGRGPLPRFFLGSVSEFLLREAPCDVLVGRPEPYATPD